MDGPDREAPSEQGIAHPFQAVEEAADVLRKFAEGAELRKKRISAVGRVVADIVLNPDRFGFRLPAAPPNKDVVDTIAKVLIDKGIQKPYQVVNFVDSIREAMGRSVLQNLPLDAAILQFLREGEAAATRYGNEPMGSGG